MRRPVCGSCERLGRLCVYPIRQKQSGSRGRIRRNLQNKSSRDTQRVTSDLGEDIADQRQSGYTSKLLPAIALYQFHWRRKDDIQNDAANEFRFIEQISSAMEPINPQQTRESFQTVTQSQPIQINFDHYNPSINQFQSQDRFISGDPLSFDVVESDDDDSWGIPASIAYELWVYRLLSQVSIKWQLVIG